MSKIRAGDTGDPSCPKCHELEADEWICSDCVGKYQDQIIELHKENKKLRKLLKK